MDNKKANDEVDALDQRGGNRGFWDRFYRSQNIMIPIELDQQHQSIGFYPVNNQDLPEGGQNNLNEITGTPFKAELAGMTVIASPVMPEVKKSYIRALTSLADSIDHCDHSTHSDSTRYWAHRLASAIHLPAEEVEMIGLAGKLHDIGKAVVSKELLIKPGPLTEKEWKTMRMHPSYSAALMEPSLVLNPVRILVRWHHEWYDGSGYPDGLVGKDIPFGSRILAIADAFSSMTVGRVYRTPISYQEALEELEAHQGTQFDPDLVAFMRGVIASSIKQP
jgi:HD-GYP domain-containing protein (c-di-GMP phosphodiesterase class II)